jgi:hypothetical protein
VGFIPEGARWYLADLVVEHRIDGEAQNVVHVNTHLVEARSPEEAYAKAMALGQAEDGEYENAHGQRVRVVFRGLRQLNVIHDPLEDGAELMYDEWVGVPEDQLQAWVRPKDRLGVFAPIQGREDGPSLMPGWFPEFAERVLASDTDLPQEEKAKGSGVDSVEDSRTNGCS